MNGSPLISDPEQAILIAARTAHEANRVYCAGLGDSSQLPWEQAPEWQRNSALAGVRAIIARPNMCAEDSHECWMKMKREEGWIYGPVKDPEKRTHPCMVEYDQLPAAHRAKDTIFGAVVRGILGL